MEGDETLGSFSAPEPSGSGGGSMFIPIAIGLVGVLLGGIALYLAFAGSGKSTEAQSAIAAATAQADALEQRLAGIEEKLASLTSEVSAQDTRLRTLAGQTQTALNQVGLEINASRKQLDANTEKVAEISSKLASANTVAPSPAPTAPSTSLGNAPSSSLNGSAAPAHREHSIASGETFAKLASKYKVSVDDILAANPDADPRRLQVGQVIKIPHSDHARE